MSANETQVVACLVFFVFIFYFVRRKKYVIAAICAIAFANYVAINLDIGVLSTKVGPTTASTPTPMIEEDYIPRYVDWSLTTPLLVLALLLKCNITDPAMYIFLLVLDVLMVYTGFLAATTSDAQTRYWLFAVSSFFYLYLFYLVFALCYATHPGLCLFLFFAWMLYPTLWMLHRTPTDHPALDNYNYDAIIAALDVFSKVGYGLLLPM